MSVDATRVLPRRWYFPAAAAVVVAMAAVLWSPLPRPVRAGTSDWGVALVTVLTVVALWSRARATDDLRRRRSWQLFAVAALVALLGNVVPLLPSSAQSREAQVASAVAAMLVSCCAVAYFPSLSLSTIELARVLADGLVVGVSLFGILLGVTSAVEPGFGRDVAEWEVLLLPLADCVIVTVLIIMVLRSTPADYARFYTAALGFLCIGVADAGVALRQLTAGTATHGEPSDLGWFVGYVSIIVAVLWRDRSVPPAAVSGENRPLLGTTTVYALFVTAAVALMVASVGEVSGSVRLVIVLGASAAAVRELVVTYDNVHLRRGLNHLVERRTQQLRDSAEVSTAVAGSVADGILAADLSGRLTYANTAAATLLGCADAQLIGRPMGELVDLAPDDDTTRQPLRWFDEVVEHGRVSTVRTQIRQLGGLSIPVQITASPLTRPGRRTGCVVTFRDLREEERIEQLKSEFVSTVSHELRTPLTSIRGVLGLMVAGRLGPLAPQAVPMVKIAADSSERLTRLVNDLLDVERLQAGQLPHFPAEVDLAELAQRAVEQSRPLFTTREVRVDLQLPPDQVVAWGDPDRIQQVLINLLSNAAKYAPDGSEVEVALTCDPRGLQGRGCVAVAVSDTGSGIPADKLDAIFERFVQADQKDNRAKEGTGLGLAIARQLAVAMHGSLRVASEPWCRTTFTLELPLVARRTSVPPAAVTAPGGSVGSS